MLKDAEEEVYYTNENLSVSDFEITNAKCEKAGDDKTYISYNSNGETDITISFDYKYTLSNKVDGTSEEKNKHRLCNDKIHLSELRICDRQYCKPCGILTAGGNNCGICKQKNNINFRDCCRACYNNYGIFMQRRA